MTKRYEIWIEISANKNRILDKKEFRSAIQKCRDIGMTDIILSVKDTTGFAIYPSQIAPHYSLYDSAFQKDFDYVAQCFQIIREMGMKCYAAFDVFTGGNRKTCRKEMPGIKNEGFACEVYGVDENQDAVVKPSLEAGMLHTIGSIDDFGEIFLNPGNSKVRDYAKSLILEFVQKYHPNGIVLDRVRYVGLSTDFSELSRKQWEEFSGITDEKWPEDIYTIQKTQNGYRENPGKYFGSFITYRMQVIHDFIEDLGITLHKMFPEVELCDYVGSWYPLYDRVGANWASKEYQTHEFSLCNQEQLRKSAYAECVDTLLCGCYYEEITIREAQENCKPAYWYSVEGAAKLSAKVAGSKNKIVGALFLDQYRDTPEKISQAIEICMKNSAGCMLFDLSYLVDENWWKYTENVQVEPWKRSDLKESAEVCEKIFPKEYLITERKIKEYLLKQKEFDCQASFTLRKTMDGKMIGVIGVKTAENQELYPSTAWISIFGIDRDYQDCGYGTILLHRTLGALRKKGIKKVCLGQDFANFFSGIPKPDEKKCRFFQNEGFHLNAEEHYDLEGNISENEQIENFNTDYWEQFYETEVFQGEKKQFLSFLHHEFPGRWEYEAEKALEKKKDPREILLLWKKDRSEILGYCMLSVEKNVHGQKTCGGLGPIGISKKIRGQHVGNYLLCQSLRQLDNLGVELVNIDWTILKDFYGQFGFQAVRIYRAGYLLLE